MHEGALAQNQDSRGNSENPHSSDADRILENPRENEKSGDLRRSGPMEDMRTEDEPYGSYTLNGDSRIAFSMNGVSYEGVIVQLNDEAGNPTMCITGVGENQSAWAVKYI
jgi:hypothetical protein